jgi:hypothetical protein
MVLTEIAEKRRAAENAEPQSFQRIKIQVFQALHFSARLPVVAQS